jgi:hypothetical protein
MKEANLKNSETIKPKTNFKISMYDAVSPYRYGEVEGFEFSADGILYNIRDSICFNSGEAAPA